MNEKEFMNRLFMGETFNYNLGDMVKPTGIPDSNGNVKVFSQTYLRNEYINIQDLNLSNKGLRYTDENDVKHIK